MEPTIHDSCVELIPIDVLSAWRNPNASPCNETALLKDIDEQGVLDPIILGVGLWSRRVRLDTGNHRIYLCPKLGMTHLPVVAKVGNYCIFDERNGDHSVSCEHILLNKNWLNEHFYARPTDIINMPALVQAYL